MKATVDALAARGLTALGSTNIYLDGGWSASRAANGSIVVDP